MNCLIFKLEEIRRGAYHRVYDTGYVPFLFLVGRGVVMAIQQKLVYSWLLKEHKGKLTSRKRSAQAVPGVFLATNTSTIYINMP